MKSNAYKSDGGRNPGVGGILGYSIKPGGGAGLIYCCYNTGDITVTCMQGDYAVCGGITAR